MTSYAPFTHDHYRALLSTAQASGYRFIGCGEVTAARHADHPAVLLRHDCDNDLVAAATMAAIEADHGVQSTYFIMTRSVMYNLLAEPVQDLVHSILAHGHWLGIHFDAWHPSAASGDLVAAVSRDKAWVETELGATVSAISFHQPGPAILENRVSIPWFNTYDRHDTAGFHYLSDSNLDWKEGDPVPLIEQLRYPRLQLLIHPEWWTETEMELPRKWDQMLLDNFMVKHRTLLAREAAYVEDKELIIRAIGDKARAC